MRTQLWMLFLAIAAVGCNRLAPTASPTTTSGQPSPRPGGVGPVGPVADPDLKRMQGEWKLLMLERGTSKLTYGKEALSNILTIDGNRFDRKWLGRAGVMLAKLDSTKAPKAIDLTFLDSEGNVAKTYFTPPDGRVIVLEGRVTGIYDLQGDSLKICFPDTMSTARPTDFHVGTEPDRSVLTLQRIK